MRRVSFLPVLVALMSAGSAFTPALAQDGAPPRPTTVIVQPKAPVAGPKAKAAPQISFVRPSSPTDRYASPVDQASQCRAQCSETHNVCAVDDSGAGGQCDSEWSRCNVRCSGTGYPFHSSAFKRGN